MVFRSVRLRLALWQVAIVALLLITFCYGLYAVLRRNSYASADNVLISVDSAVAAMLQQQLSESGLEELAARSAVTTLNVPEHTLEIFDSQGNLIAENPVGSSERISLPNPGDLVDGKPLLYTAQSLGSVRDLRRVAAMRSQLGPEGHRYLIITSRSLTPLLGELDQDRRILSIGIPGGLLLAGLIAFWLVRMTLLPVVRMSEQAREMGAQNLDRRFLVTTGHDEFTLLALTFNDLLERVDASLGMQRQFVADASHELKTPLSVIRLAASVALGQTTPELQDYRESLVIIEEQAKRMTRMVEDMFRLALSDVGENASEQEPLYLEEVVEDALRGAVVIAAPKGIRIQKELEIDCLFEGDGSALKQLLLNLLDNAVKYNEPNGSVRVTLRRNEDEYIIVVSDTGIGIDPMHRKRVFDRFYRVDPGHRWPESDLRTGGAGLGLAIARSIAESHRGSLVLLDTSDKGSVFEIRLPIPVMHGLV